MKQRIILLLASCLLASASCLLAASLPMRIGTSRYQAQVVSMAEIRWNKLTRQGWDISCGAAALSTLLTFHNQHPYSELAITLSILKNSDPSLVKQRGGFSLYDLKRFVRAIGLEGLGYGDMSLDDLENFGLPAILPLRIRDFDHFVVFRRRIGDHILIGDPAFGNISLPAHRFKAIWKSGIAFYVVKPENKDQVARRNKAGQQNLLSPEAMEVAIPSLLYDSRLHGRMPTTPLTRRNRVFLP